MTDLCGHSRRRARGRSGRFFSTRCPDANCEGTLVEEEAGRWRCNGLTHVAPTSRLVACRMERCAGDY